ncbi:MAG TPA: hypothetical protein VFH68_22365 [Polyangia bacterium]|jgi:hypothetical protein|nr:hypothetical protein [Polyangia bacterium]
MAFPVGSLVMVAVVLGGSLLYRRWMMGRMQRQSSTPEARAAMVRFFESTGYRDPAAPDGDAQALAEATMQRMARAWEAAARSQPTLYEGGWVREFDGMPVTYSFSSGGATSVNEWTVPLPRPPRLHWRLYGGKTGHATTPAAAGPSDGWRRIRPADPELADRFVVEANADEASVQALLGTPGLKEALLSCAHVDLEVGPSTALFRDPLSRNVYAAMGGYFGAMMSAANLGKTFEVAAPVHDNVADVLTRAVRASA